MPVSKKNDDAPLERKLEMKKKKLLAATAMTLGAVLAIALVGCGSGTPSSASAPSSASTASTASSPALTPPVKKIDDLIVGTWKLAAAESEGLVMTGDFFSILGQTEKEGSSEGNTASTLTVNENGTGEFDMSGEKRNFKWTASDDDITLTFTTDEGKENNADASFDIDGNILKVEMTDENSNSNMKNATLIFTADGTYEKARKISMDEATPITSRSDLEGIWKISGIGFMGVSAYGDSDTLMKIGGGNTGIDTVTFNSDGTLDFGTSTSGTWEVDSNGASMTIPGVSENVTIPVKKLEDEIAFDLSPSLGDVFGGESMVFVYAK